ncbi:MAG: hypothetical protein Greene071421_98 [Parcubacteria group bacterium Greene0714_21]|nr:MAG: hypothetical protein Greene041639_253 [Parcubacteria group bacterium Greene0416_39]TSC98500.1 MAG: hypothetical protein Greene101447_2 [Parcubacteria group bacterium Greene1014_47]TSD04262.1 MAG: hypothetical protein Greene071421_98 [Parcubacteria group bacterium Greene0714_21]
MKILFTGGGTGGHILPIVAIAREIRKISGSKDVEFFYLGPQDDFGTMFLSQEGIKVSKVLAGKLRRYGGVKAILQNIVDLFFFVPFGIMQAFWKLFVLAPDVIVSKGGYGALPATIAGWLLRIPIFLHESDSVAGLANRIGATFALKLFTSFPRTKNLSLEKAMAIGNPIRKEILAGSKAEAAEIFKLKGGYSTVPSKGDKPVLLVLGGSQGAQRINDMLLLALNDALDVCEIIHQTGEKNFDQVVAEAKVVMKSPKDALYHPRPFLPENELKHAYAVSDFVVSRAGSGIIFEVAALGKPSILIPLPESAQGHQLENAYEYARTGAAIVLEESNLTPHFFLEKLRYLLHNPQELQKMSQAALSFAKPAAAKTLAQYILEYLKS